MIKEIALITDCEYIVPALVTIRSLKKTMKKDEFFRLNVIYDVLDDSAIELFKQEECENIKIVFHECNQRIEEFHFQHLYVSKASILKFFLPDILENCSVVLYVDSDLLFREDISSLFSLDINDYYACVVKDMKCTKEGDPERIGLKNYFNSGVMLLNLEKMREENISRKLLEYKIKLDSGKFMDQDSLNYVLNEKLKFISPMFNSILPFFLEYSEQEIDDFYGEKCRLSEARIIHFAGANKPWNDFCSPLYKEWIDYLNVNTEILFMLKSYEEAFSRHQRQYNALWDINEKREQQIRGIDCELGNQSKKLMQLMDNENKNEEKSLEVKRTIASVVEKTDDNEKTIASVNERINETIEAIEQITIWKIIRNSFKKKKGI